MLEGAKSLKLSCLADQFCLCLDGQLYSGTVSDFSGLDALIIKDQIRTEQSNLKHLNGE
jgi:hypothetical protein